MNEENMSRELPDLSGAAVRGEAVAKMPKLPKEFGVIDIYHDDGHVTSVDGFTGDQMRGYAIDYAFSLGMALPRAADSPSEPSNPEIVAIARQAIRDGNAMWDQFEKDENGKFTLPVLDPKDFMLVRAVLAAVKSRAADALDSQPTVHKDVEWLVECAEMAKRNPELATTLRNKCRPSQPAASASQPTVAAQQGSIADDAQFQALLDNVTQNYGAFLQNTNVHGFMSAVAGLHAYVDHLLDSRAPAAPVAPLAPDAVIALKSNYKGDPNFRSAYLDGFCAAKAAVVKLLATPAPQQEGSEASNG